MTHKMLPRQELIHRLPVEECYLLEEVLLHILIDRDYRFGRLHFPEPLEEDYPDFIAEPPECLKGGWTWWHEVDMVFDERRGGLLLRDSDEKNLQETYREMLSLQRKIRGRVVEDPAWLTRPVVLDVAIVVNAPFHECSIPADVPREILIWQDELDGLPGRLDKIFGHYVHNDVATEDLEANSRLLIDLFTQSNRIGSFHDEDDAIRLFNDLYRRYNMGPEAA